MNTSLFYINVFLSITVIIFFDAQIVLSLGNENLF